MKSGRRRFCKAALAGLACQGFSGAWAAATMPAAATGRSRIETGALPTFKTGESVRDPVFGHRLRRVSAAKGAGSPWLDNTRHIYSKVAAFDASGDWLLLRSFGKSGTEREQQSNLLLLDTRDWRPARQQVPPCSDWRWWNQRSGEALVVVDDLFKYYSVRSGKTTSLDEINSLVDGYADFRLMGESNLSDDDGSLVVLARKRDADRQQLLWIDLKTPRIVGKLSADYPRLDFATVSPSGRFMVVNGELLPGEADRSQVFDSSGKPLGKMWSPYGFPSHYDLTIDRHGDEVAVGVAKTTDEELGGGIRAGSLVSRRLVDGKVRLLLEGGYAVHTSCRNLALPGWCFVSYMGRHAEYPPFGDELVAVRTDGSGDFVRICQFRHTDGGYWAQPQACPNRQGTRAVFASNWLRADGNVQAYVVEVNLA